jgi:hypothetical protein
MAAELPPHVFPNSDAGLLRRQGEELPPSVFPNEFDKSHVSSYAEHDGTHLIAKGTINKTEKVTNSVAKQTPTEKIALAFHPPQPLFDAKGNSSHGMAPELPPHVFPNSDAGLLHRQGEELPPSVFPNEFDKSNISSYAEHDGTHLIARGTINKTEKITNSVVKQTPTEKIASEVPDLLSSDAYNRTVYEDGTEGPIQNDTVTVTGPNVINNNKTHEEDITAPSVEKKENVTNESNNKSDSVTSDLSSLDANNTTFDDNQYNTAAQGKLNASTITEGNMTSTEEFTQDGNVMEEVAKHKENDTSPSDALEAFTTVAVTEANIAVNYPKKNYSISDKNKERKVKTKYDNRTVKDETTAKTKLNTTIKDETTIKTESKATIKDETTATSEAVSLTTKELSATQSTSTPSIWQSEITTLQPTLKGEATTSINISENIIDHKAEDTPVALAASQQHADHSHASSGKSSAFLQPTESAAILAGVFVGIALIGYVGLLVWRRVLE